VVRSGWQPCFRVLGGGALCHLEHRQGSADFADCGTHVVRYVPLREPRTRSTSSWAWSLWRVLGSQPWPPVGALRVTAYRCPRTREIGFASSLGGTHQDVLSLVLLRQGPTLALGGVATVVVASLGLTRGADDRPALGGVLGKRPV